ncbi:unnamed protein product [Heterobilharzia americana]|nr:unnamed protein product [Heterobilharzia americana]
MYSSHNHLHNFINNIIIIIISIIFLLLNNSISYKVNLNKFSATGGKFNSELCDKWTLNTLSHGLNVQLFNYSNIYQYIPQISIIIIAHNENILILQKTIKSIMINTNELLMNNRIKEIILIDDYSNPAIQMNIGLLNKTIRVLRNPKRMGLIKSRMNGARNASGDILVFLDAHIETLNHWLEPLIVQLISLRKQSRHHHHQQQHEESQWITNEGTSKPLYNAKHFIVSPIILSTSDKIDYDNIEDNLYLGGFSWDLIFRWHHVNEVGTVISPSFGQHETDAYRLIQPRPTPALAGGIFAVWRDDFFYYGGYDEEMIIWGGENIELSLRTWMCHGQIEIIPCSRVGHLFRDQHPYTFPMGKEFTILHNYKRTVLVWFLHDINSTLAREYLGYFYTRLPEAKMIPPGDLKSRKLIPTTLNCHSFTWYLENIYPLLRQEAKSIQINQDTYFVTAFDTT